MKEDASFSRGVTRAGLLAAPLRRAVASILLSPFLQASIRREGDGYVLNGVKWWTSGAMDPRCGVAIFMGKTDPSAPPHQQQSMVLVPMDAAGVKVQRPMLVFGYDDAPHGHAEVHFDNVRVPAHNMVLGEGRGFEIAQVRGGHTCSYNCIYLYVSWYNVYLLVLIQVAQGPDAGVVLLNARSVHTPPERPEPAVSNLPLS